MGTKDTDTQQDTAEVILRTVSELAWHVVKLAALVSWWALLFPMVSLPVAGVVAAGLFLGWLWVFVVVGVSIAGMVLWCRRSPATFERWFTGRARTRVLRWWRYRLRWDTRLGACKLTVVRETSTFVPRLLSAEIGHSLDRVQVRMLDGQCPADWENRVDRLAHAFKALDCRASVVGPGVVELLFRRSDALAEPIELPPVGVAGWGKDAL